MKLLKHDVAVGDRFERIGPLRTTYEVISLVEKPGLPLHVRLVSDQRSGRELLLVSVSALTDSSLFRRVRS